MPPKRPARSSADEESEASEATIEEEDDDDVIVIDSDSEDGGGGDELDRAAGGRGKKECVKKQRGAPTVRSAGTQRRLPAAAAEVRVIGNVRAPFKVWS